ncbi:MAG: penicillin-binding protein 2 [Holosporales bacterium]|jgi:penicillin-binding protein 2|nr:penicillin-binding protein 2 [Holosporales bacterium]
MRKKPKDTLFTDRIRFAISATVLLTIVLIGRLYYLQVVQHEKYALLSNRNRIRIRPIIPKRGRIIALNNIPLAFTGAKYRLVGDSSVRKDLESDIKSLLADPQAVQFIRPDLFQEARKTPPYSHIIIKDEMAWAQANQCLPLLNKYKTLYLDNYYYRVYPLEASACHIVGYMSAPSTKQALPLEYKCGKTGIEEHFDPMLAGEFGVKKTEVNARSVPVKDLCDDKAESGQDLETTIDAGLQKLVYQLLSVHKAASCVVMNIENGHILAMVSVPGFDPNKLTSNQKYWQHVMQASTNPLMNRSIAGLYPPGSTFKPIVALAALKAGVIDRNTKIFCPGYMRLGNHIFHCWKHAGHGYVNVEQAIASSCDVFFYNLGLRLKLSDITEMAEVFGLGDKTEVNVPHEQSGKILIGKPSGGGRAARRVLTAIGQGSIVVTPIGLCVMTAQIANGGYRVFPTLSKGKMSPRESLGISPKHIEIVKNGMFWVCNKPGSSGYARGYSARYPIAGKTGTAQVVSLSDKRGHSWQYKDHALFIAYGPADRPKYAVAVVVDHGTSGALSCIPVARQVFDYIEANEKPADN